MSSPLTHISNKSQSSGIFPDHLKYAVVKPLFKKGDKSNIYNYRPVSILISPSKLLEKVMYSPLQEHLNKFSILAEEKFGFRIDSTTNKAIYKLINETLKALNNIFMVGGIFFNLEKAWLFKSYYLPVQTTTDDTSIIVKSPNSTDFQTNMVTAFDGVNKSFKVNLFSININKTHYTQFKTKNKPTLDINIVSNDNLITALPNVMFLGIYIHNSINWSCHIEYIIPKLSSACYIMRSIKPFMSLYTLKTIY